MKRVLGIDLGIASLGWSLVEFENDEYFDPNTGEIKDGRIVDCGVRIFTQAETPDRGESLAKPRREARGKRRSLRRKARRMQGIKNLFVRHNLIAEFDLSNLYDITSATKDVWDLRVEGLDRKLNNQEFARVLTTLAKRRGYKSSRKTEEENDSENGKVLKAIKENKDAFNNGEYRTLAEMIVKTTAKDENKRNKIGSYKNSIPRTFVIEEIEKLFAAQTLHGNTFATNKFKEDFCKIAFRQRDIASVESMIGYCTFEDGENGSSREKRAPRESYTAETFNSWCKINNLSYIDGDDRKHYLNKQEKSIVLELLHSKAQVTYKQIRTALDLQDCFKFTGLNYLNKDAKDPETMTFYALKGYNALRKAIESVGSKLDWQNFANDKERLDDIVRIIATEKSDENIQAGLNDLKIGDKYIDALMRVSFSKFLHLSLKAMRKIIPYLEQGYKYVKACELAGYDPKKTGGLNYEKQHLLPVLQAEDQTTVPAVNRAISQFRKTINAIIRQHGSFDQMNIELAREIHNSSKKRNEIKRGQADYKAEKDKAEARCIEAEINPSGANLLKFRLYEQQDGKCLYSGKPIEIERLCEIGYCDIDHILPYSRSMDDSLNNKIICLAGENRQKGNKTPYEYIYSHRGEIGWNDFKGLVSATKGIKQAKRNRLLKEKFAKEDAEGFKARNLNDTRYMARFISNYVASCLEFKENNHIKQKVQIRSGGLTSYLRHQWGLAKNRDEDGDLHHAIDATIVACATQGMVQRVSKISQIIEDKETFKAQVGLKKDEAWFKGLRKNTLQPWSDFRFDVLEAVNRIFVSRAPRRKVTGQAHKEKIRSAKKIHENVSVLKTPLREMIKKQIDKNGDFPMYNKSQSMKLYNTIKNRLLEYDNNPEKAFVEPLYMPTNNGSQGHVINSVKLETVQKSGLMLQDGKSIADNGEMLRVDVFSKKNKKGKEQFFLVPIYISAAVQNVLPNKAIAAAKSEDEWLEMDETYDFKFSLSLDDLISVKKGEQEYFGYYKGTHRTNGTITLEGHARKWKKEGVGAKNQDCFKKYQVDTLGKYHEIKSEPRLPIKMKVK